MTVHAKQQRQRIHYWFDVLVIKAASIIIVADQKRKNQVYVVNQKKEPVNVTFHRRLEFVKNMHPISAVGKKLIQYLQSAAYDLDC